MRELETLKEAGSRAAGLRILIGRRTGSSYTSDLSPDGIRHLVRSAIELADITTEDPHAGLPEPAELGSIAGDLGLYCGDVADLDTAAKIDLARRAEDAALAADPRIANSEGASFDSNVGRHVFANSRGFAGEYRTSYCSLSTVPVAREGDSMERDYWYLAGARRRRPGSAGGDRPHRRRRARCGAWAPVKVETQKVPVVFEPRTARSAAGQHLRGRARHVGLPARIVPGRKAGREGRLGQADGDRRRHASRACSALRPFDDEGVPSRRTVVIENGVLKSYLLNTYAARKLGMKTTGNASRGPDRQRGHRARELLHREGRHSRPSRSSRASRNGFYVTELIGFGVNIVTGDYSRGAAGHVDSRRRTGVRGLGGDHRGQPEGHAAGPGDDRLATWSSAGRSRRPHC